MSDTTPKPPCGVCKGSYKEHFDDDGKPITQHAYTALEGDLVTHQEMAKRQSPPARAAFNPSMLMAQNPAMAGRLTEVLLDLKLIGVEHALYVAGMGPKPPAPSGYQDPLSVMGRQ